MTAHPTGHERARLLAGAAYDGELDPALRPELDAHLAGCPDCRGYAAALGPLGRLVAAAPRERAPAALPHRVAARLAPRRRRAWLLAPVATLAACLALVAVVLGAAPVVPLPEAGAAAPLATLRTLYVEREVVEGGTVARERIWFRAPGDLRVERTVAGATEVEIRRPGERWSHGVLERGLPPEVVLPEPLSPTVALLGRDTGPGPVVAGTPTRRYELALADGSRVAYVAADTLPVLGGEDVHLVVEKGPDGELAGRVALTKRVLRYEVDAPVDPALFVPPRGGPVVDRGFRADGDLPVEPAAAPRGFAVVARGAGPDGAAVLYARGALQVLVTVTTLDERGRATVRPVDVGGRPAVLLLDLYAPPAVRFGVAGHVVTVSAPLPPDSLAALAAAMFPAAE